ncbi:hypothetical protein [Paraburkholderia sp. JPY419]|uniref:hypothetical protein n=1 Tax=Paraburkholderia sp. JPY419 TaxID=667660 RepID=UPI003D209ADD
MSTSCTAAVDVPPIDVPEPLPEVPVPPLVVPPVVVLLPPLAAAGVDAPDEALPPALVPVGALLFPPPPPPQFVATIAATAIAVPNRLARSNKRIETMADSPLLAVAPQNMGRVECPRNVG